MSNLERFQKWMSDQGESAVYIGDGQFEGIVSNKMYDAWCAALTAPASVATVFCADCERQVIGPCNSEIRCSYEGAKAVASGAALSGELPPLPEPLEIDWPQLHSEALGCGVEDRNIHDRYEAAEYGWQDGVDKAAERVPDQIYDAEQMHAYARAAITQVPKEALTDEQIKQAAEMAWPGMPPHWLDRHDGAVHESTWKFARAIEAASAPNAKLVALIQKAQAILAIHLPPDGPDAKTTISALLGLLDGPESRAALADAGVKP